MQLSFLLERRRGGWGGWGGVEPLPSFQKWGLTGSQFLEGVAGKEGEGVAGFA